MLNSKNAIAQLKGLTPDGIKLSSFVQGYWRLNDWKLSAQQLLSFTKQHLELGISSVDHASIYGAPPCEQLFGQALAIQPTLRNQLQIITKCGIYLEHHQENKQVSYYNSTRADIIASVELSLKRLNSDYIDLLLLHRPDFLLNADEVAEAFEQLKSQGKVLHFGVSNYSVGQFELLQSRLSFPLATNQLEINPVNMSAIHDGTLDQLQRLTTKPMAWSVLAGGSLFTGQTAQLKRLREAITDIAAEIGAQSFEQVVYRWVLELPSDPLIILGSGKIERIQTALNASQLSMTREQWYRIWVASQGHSVA